jgi:tRNA A37 threonylcarbamoyladenosine synthetase subunit TsaC/SUA5/YrdC
LIAPGEVEPLNDAETIREQFEHNLAAIIDAGACASEPTTVIDLTGGSIEIVRQGRGELARLGL